MFKGEVVRAIFFIVDQICAFVVKISDIHDDGGKCVTCSGAMLAQRL